MRLFILSIRIFLFFCAGIFQNAALATPGFACHNLFLERPSSQFAFQINYAKEFELTRLRATSVLKRDLSNQAVDLIFQAHLVGLGEAGENANLPAQPGNFTFSQLREKVTLLKKNQDPEVVFSNAEIRSLFEASVVGVSLPSWTKLPPREQFERYGVMVTNWRPELTDQQINRIYQDVNKANRFPYGEILLSSPQDLFFAFGGDTAEALKKYISQVEAFAGRRVSSILLRTDESRQQVLGGHTHDMRSHSTGTIALIGAGSFFKVGGIEYDVGSQETVYFRDGERPIFHGTPSVFGRRLILVLNFES